MRSGASHPGPHLSCVPDLPLSPRRRRHERFSPITPAQASASFAEAQLQTSHFAMTDPQLCGWPAACLLLRRAKRGRRPQCPGNQSRSARFWKFPPATHSREPPVTADSAAITWPSQELSRFDEHTFRQIAASRNTKSARHCAETVDVDTSLWKS